MRDILVSLIVIGAMPLCFRRPIVGLLMFSILAYMRLQDLAWGFARYQRWSYYVALLTLAGYFTSPERKPPVLEKRTMMMIALCVLVGVGILTSRGVLPDDESERYGEYVKIIFIAIFTTAIVQTREHLRMLMWVIGMCFAFFGVKAGLSGIVHLGNVYIKRGPGGMLEDNNDFALAMAMAIPVLFHLGTSERRDILRKATWSMIPLTMITVVLTRSRGGTLSMSTAVALLVWRSRNRVIGFMIMFLAAGAVVALAPSEYKARLATIKDYENEGSAMGRIKAWKVAGRMIKDNPIMGVGMRHFQINYVDYEPNPSAEQLSGEGTIVAHNSYLQIWAECGTIAFSLYMGLLFLSFWDLWGVRRRAKRLYYQSWILSYCAMFEAVLATFMVGSMFLNRAHFDLVYHYHAIVLCFGRIARAQMDQDVKAPQRVQGRRAGGLVPVRSAGFGRSAPAVRTFRSTPLVTKG